MKTPLLPGEIPVREAPANLQRGLETVGGRAFLTDRRLIFESHAFNIQTGATVIDRADITGAIPCWTKFLGVLPLFPNSMAVSTRDGGEYRFVIGQRAAWIAAILQEPVGHSPPTGS